MTGILQRLIQNKKAPNPLAANGVNFQVLVGEDAALDGKIRSEDPDNDLVVIPGFSSACTQRASRIGHCLVPCSWREQDEPAAESDGIDSQQRRDLSSAAPAV